VSKKATIADLRRVIEELVIELADLKSRFARLASEHADLQFKYNELIAEKNALLAERDALVIERDALRDRLSLNSKNSSISSSKDLYKQKRHGRKSGKNHGAQHGHKGVNRQPMDADTVVEVPLAESLCSCGGEIVLGKPHVHQRVDIPEIKPRVTEFRMERGVCGKCGKKKRAACPVPMDTFGPRVKTIIASLTAFYKNSKREVQCILKDIFNLKISLGSISKSEHRASQRCAEAHELIGELVKVSDIIHADETSHYNKGKLGWAWMFASKDYSFLKIESTRGKKVLKNNGFDPEGSSIKVTDRYGAYNYFNSDNRQLCWAHLARNFERFATSQNQTVRTLGFHMVQTCRVLFGLHKCMQSKSMSIDKFLNRANKLRRKLWYYLKQASMLPSSLGTTKIVNNMMSSEDMMWKFLENPNAIPLTNNHAERQIRHYVTYRKNSYFTQSERGDRFLERLISVYLTYKQTGHNPFLFLLDAMSQKSG
jgi:transposase